MFRQVQRVLFAAAVIAGFAGVSAEEYKLNRYSTTPETWNTNSYWLESDKGIVLIDAQLLIEDAKLLAALIKSRNKPVAGAIITHPHGDHIGGLNTLRSELGDFPVITSQKTADTFEASYDMARQYTEQPYGDRFDKTLVKATRTISGKEEITLAGIRFILEDIGPGESESATLIYQPDRNILFSGDATMHHSHAYTGEGHSTGYIKQLEHIKNHYSDVEMIYPGHGDAARPTYVDFQIKYIKDIQAVAENIMREGNYHTEDGMHFSPAIIEKHANRIIKKYPSLGDYGLPTLQIVISNIAGVLFEKNNRSQVAASD